MADKQKTIDIIFGAVDNTGTAIKGVTKNLQGLERSVGSVTGPLAGVADSVLQLDAAMAAAAVGITAYSIKLADEFGTAFAEIATLIGEPADSLLEFKDSIRSYAEQSTASFSEITTATYNAISSGVAYGDSLDVVAQAERLAIAGKSELGVTTKALVSVMNAFGAEMSDAEKYSDIFFTTVKNGQTTMPELADAIARVAPLAASAGLGFDELAAAIQAVTAETGTSTAETMTALRATIAAIIKPTKEASEKAAELGINFNASALQSKGLAGVLAEVSAATGNNVEEITKLFGGQEALAAVLPLTGKAAKAFADNIIDVGNSTGETEKAAGQLENTLSNLGQTLNNNVTSAFSSFGENFTDETAGIIQSLSNSFGSLGSEIRLSDGAFEPIISQLEGLFKDIENKFAVMAENLPAALEGLDFSDLVVAFEGMGSVFGDNLAALFGDIDLSTVEGLEAALQSVINTFESLVNITTGVFEGLEPLFSVIGSAVSTFNELDGSTQQLIFYFIGLSKTVNTLLPVVGLLGTGLGAVSKGLGAIAGIKSLGILTSLTKLQALAATAGNAGLVGTALFGGMAIGEGINQLFESFTGDSIGTLLYEWINGDKANQALVEMEVQLESTGDAAKKFAEEQNAAADSADNIIEPVEMGAAAYEAQADAMLAANNAAGNFVESAYDVADSAGSAGGALEKVKIKTDAAADAAKKAAKETKEYQLKLLEIASDERIANIEANVSLNIAALEADTKKAVAIIEVLGASIQSTGDLLGSLFGNLENATGSKRFDIERQIDKENALRKESFAQTKKLSDAQIELFRAKARQIAKGDALIKVSAEGLTPALELIFNEVLEYTQVRANEQGLEFLTGV